MQRTSLASGRNLKGLFSTIQTLLSLMRTKRLHRLWCQLIPQQRNKDGETQAGCKSAFLTWSGFTTTVLCLFAFVYQTINICYNVCLQTPTIKWHILYYILYTLMDGVSVDAQPNILFWLLLLLLLLEKVFGITQVIWKTSSVAI